MKGIALLLITVLLVAVLVLGPAAPVQAGHSLCVDGQLWNCVFNDDGTMSCTVMGTCQSEGGEERETDCTEGAVWSWARCRDNSFCRANYRCTGGAWVLLGSSCVERTCERVAEIVCYRAPGADSPECREITNGTPCEDLNWSASGIQCEGMYDLSVSVSVPCQRVTRIPYPRGMVAVPNSLSLANSPAWNEAWSATLDYNACLQRNISLDGRKVRNYRIGLAWGRMDNMLPYWELAGIGSFRGRSVTVVWERSSFGQPVCGPGLQAGRRLPAFPGRVYTYWTAYWRTEYQVQIDKYECVSDWRCSVEGYSCEARCDRDGDGINDDGTWLELVRCNDDDNRDGIPDDHCWETRDSGWQAIDLRTFGYSTSYFVSRASGPAPTALEPNPGCNGFCVPVIEVQGVIENPR